MAINTVELLCTEADRSQTVFSRSSLPSLLSAGELMLKSTATLHAAARVQASASLSSSLKASCRYSPSLSTATLGSFTAGAPRPRWRRQAWRVTSIAMAQRVRPSRSYATASSSPSSLAFSLLPSSSSSTASQRMTALAPPQPPPRWDHSSKEVFDLTGSAIDHAKHVLDTVGALKAEECTFKSVCECAITIGLGCADRMDICQGL